MLSMFSRFLPCYILYRYRLYILSYRTTIFQPSVLVPVCQHCRWPDRHPLKLIHWPSVSSSSNPTPKNLNYPFKVSDHKCQNVAEIFRELYRVKMSAYHDLMHLYQAIVEAGYCILLSEHWVCFNTTLKIMYILQMFYP